MYNYNVGDKLKCIKSNDFFDKYFKVGKIYTISHDICGLALVDDRGYPWSMVTMAGAMKKNEIDFELIKEPTLELDLNQLTIDELQQYITKVNMVKHEEKVLTKAREEVKEAEQDLEQAKHELDKLVLSYLAKLENSN